MCEEYLFVYPMSFAKGRPVVALRGDLIVRLENNMCTPSAMSHSIFVCIYLRVNSAWLLSCLWDTLIAHGKCACVVLLDV